MLNTRRISSFSFDIVCILKNIELIDAKSIKNFPNDGDYKLKDDYLWQKSIAGDGYTEHYAARLKSARYTFNHFCERDFYFLLISWESNLLSRIFAEKNPLPSNQLHSDASIALVPQILPLLPRSAWSQIRMPCFSPSTSVLLLGRFQSSWRLL